MIDTHAHLDDSAFDSDRETLIANFERDKVDFVINNSCDLDGMKGGFALSQKYERIYCTVGMHPYYPEAFDDNFVSLMKEYAQNEKCVAVGEIGLDYHIGNEDRKAQRDMFAYQLELADKLNLPVTLHIRDAYGDALDVLNACKRYLNHAVVWHCYSGSAEFAKPLAKRGHYFALGGAITFTHKTDVIKAIPITQIMTETDCPYMTPLQFRGKRNEPKYIQYVLEKMAHTYETDYETMEKQVLANTLCVFERIKQNG